MNSKNRSKDFVENLLSLADIKVNGDRPWDIAVHNDRFYARVLSKWNLGLGESYMDGWWDSKSIDQLVTHIFKVDLKSKVSRNFNTLFNYFFAVLSNRGSRSRAFKIGEKHYNIGNDLFSAMLDKRLVYTCGYWKDTKTLDEAQENKLDLVCKKLQLKAGQTVLDIGCGWGSFAKFAAEKYGAKVLGVTVSEE